MKANTFTNQNREILVLDLLQPYAYGPNDLFTLGGIDFCLKSILIHCDYYALFFQPCASWLQHSVTC